jgi:hypothetical protein
MDLSTIEGLTPEQSEAILAMHNKETEGLKTNRDAFRGEKDAATIKAQEALQQAEDTRKALQLAEEEKLKLAGDMDGLKSHYEKVNAEQLASIKAESDKARNALLDRDKTSVMADLQTMLHPDMGYAGKAMLSSALDISYNEEGKAITTFKHNGEVVADSVESFKGWAADNSDYKQVLKGVDSGGAGVTQSSGATASNENSAFQQRLKASGLTQ